jgi:hypothetical protein
MNATDMANPPFVVPEAIVLLILSDSRGAIKEALWLEFQRRGAAGTVEAPKACSLRDDCELPVLEDVVVRLNSKDLRAQEQFGVNNRIPESSRWYGSAPV